MLVRYSRLAASDTVDIITHSRASPPLPERKLREANYCNILMPLWNIAHSDRLAAIPPAPRQCLLSAKSRHRALAEACARLLRSLRSQSESCRTKGGPTSRESRPKLVAPSSRSGACRTPGGKYVSKSARESLIFGLRPRQKVKQKQQCQRPEECEANVCQDTRSPGGAGEKQQESVPKKLGQRLPRYRGNDVSHSANNNGGSHEDDGPENTITYSFEYSFRHSLPPAGRVETRPIRGTRSSKSVA